MPNWKNESEYGFLETLKERDWAWEFLRRNAEYRNKWLDFAGLRETLEKKFGPYLAWDRKVLSQELDVWDFNPSRLEGEGFKAWQARALDLGIDPIRRLLPEAYGHPWRLACIRDPASTSASDIRFLPAPKPPIWRRLEHVGQGGADSHEELGAGMYIWFDLELPLSPQIEHVNGAAKSLQNDLIDREVIQTPASKKRGPDWWTPYIRILDADDAGAKPAEIASILYPKRDNSIAAGYAASKFVKDQLAAATRMTMRGYLSLIPYSGDITGGD